MQFPNKLRRLFWNVWQIPLYGITLGLASGIVDIGVQELLPKNKLRWVAELIAYVPIWASVFWTRQRIISEVDSGRAAQILVTPLRSRDYFLRVFLPTGVYCALFLIFALPIAEKLSSNWELKLGWLSNPADYLPSHWTAQLAAIMGFSIPLFVYSHMILFHGSWRTISGIIVPVMTFALYLALTSHAQFSLLFWLTIDLRWNPANLVSFMQDLELAVKLPLLLILFVWVAPRFRSIFDPERDKPSEQMVSIPR
jgi:hypothetical protein